MLTIHSIVLSDPDFDAVVKANPELNFEQTAEGELVVVPPTGGTSGNKNSKLTAGLKV
jgi:Uma2 family endonuclease